MLGARFWVLASIQNPAPTTLPLAYLGLGRKEKLVDTTDIRSLALSKSMEALGVEKRSPQVSVQDILLVASVIEEYLMTGEWEQKGAR